jgi:hypothetical protein
MRSVRVDNQSGDRKLHHQHNVCLYGSRNESTVVCNGIVEYAINSASVEVLEDRTYAPRVFPSRVIDDYGGSWPYSSAGYGYGGS